MDKLLRLLVPLSEALVGQTETDGTPITEEMGHNYGRIFENDTFAFREYCWCDGNYHGFKPHLDAPDEETPACPPNFEHFASGMKIEWYKHMRRGLWSEEVPTDEQIDLVLQDCLQSLKK